MKMWYWKYLGSWLLVVSLVSACQPTVADTGIPNMTPSLTTLPTTSFTMALSPIASSTVLPTVSPTTSSVPTPLPTPEVVWGYKTEAPIWGTPAISDGSVYFGSDDGNLYAVDALTGGHKWKFLTQGFVRSQPAIVNGLVYFASDDGYLYALKAQDGTQVWRTDIGNLLPSDGRFLNFTNGNSTGWDYKQSSPVVDGQVYVGSLDGNVYSLAADTGKINWMFETSQKVRATPTLADGVLYIGSWDKSMYALDAQNGQMLWETPVGGQVQSTALVVNGLVYTASRKASVVALDAQTGEKKWEYDYGGNNWVESSPQLVGNVIYIGSSAHMSVYGLDSQTGDGLIKYLNFVFFWPTPTIEGNMLYIGGWEGTSSGKAGLFALEIPRVVTAGDRMKLKWKLSLEDTLMPSNQHLVGIASSAVVQNGVVYFGALDGKFYAVKGEKKDKEK